MVSTHTDSFYTIPENFRHEMRTFLTPILDGFDNTRLFKAYIIVGLKTVEDMSPPTISTISAQGRYNIELREHVIRRRFPDAGLSKNQISQEARRSTYVSIEIPCQWLDDFRVCLGEIARDSNNTEVKFIDGDLTTLSYVLN
jgi:hypothetical protein